MLPLKDKWIVVTRPKHQAENLRLQLEAAGARVLLFPLQEIKQPDNILMVKKQLSKIIDYDLAIFISPNAVEYTLKSIDSNILGALKVAAIGKKTKALLEAKEIAVDFYPKAIANSEAFLAMPELLTFCKEKKIVILRGNGGRDLIRDTLREASNSVDYIEVYKRDRPYQNLNILSEHYYRNELDIILISSVNGLEHLFQTVSENGWLSEVTLLLGSKRIKEQAFALKEHLGELFFTQDPSDEAVYMQLLEWAKMDNQ